MNEFITVVYGKDVLEVCSPFGDKYTIVRFKVGKDTISGRIAYSTLSRLFAGRRFKMVKKRIRYHLELPDPLEDEVLYDPEGETWNRVLGTELNKYSTISYNLLGG